MSDNVPYGHGVMTSEPEAGGQATNAFDATAMAAALPDPQGGDHGSAPAEANGENGEAGTAAGADGNQAQGKYGWNDPVAHDYAELTRADAAKWDGNARVYYWDGETGDIGPEFPELEDELFGSAGSAERHAHGLDFAAIAEIQVVQEGPERIQPIYNFEDAGLHPAMLRNVQLAGYKVPTPVQKYCLPAIHLGYDVIAIAQTGSGKTAAYLVPILNKLMGKAKKLAAPRPNPATYRPGFDPPVRAEPLVVIVCPTRELAVQIFNDARKFCYRTMLRPCVLYGGGPLRDQIDQLCKGCDILIASPGRLIDMMDRPHILTLRRVKYMVIDEADEMLHPDWEDDFGKILSGGEQEEGNIKYMLFSATFPKKVRDLAKTHLADNHVRFRVGRAGSTHANIVQKVVFVEPFQKKQALWDLLHSTPPARTIIFVNSKRTADELDDYLFNQGMPSTSMHGDRTQREREDAMRAFRSGACPIMITTGVTARGIDVRNVLHVINYDLPSMDYGGIEEYTHRIGRTGRIGHRGLATSFYNEKDEPIASVLTRTLLETSQEVPDFLQQYAPEGEAREKLKFEADSDWEDENDDAGGGSGGGGWGAGGGTGGWGGGADQSSGDGGGAGWGAPAGDAGNDTSAPAADSGDNAWGGQKSTW